MSQNIGRMLPDLMSKTSSKSQIIIVKTLLQKNLVKSYEVVKGLVNFCREAEKLKSIIVDLVEILDFQRCKDSPYHLFDRIDNLTTKLLGHNWNNDELTKDTKRDQNARCRNAI